MFIRRKKAVHQHPSPIRKEPLLSFPTLVIGNPECPHMNTPCPIYLSVIPDVGNRESRVFPCRTSISLVVRYRGSHDSEVMLALPKGYGSLIEPWGKTVLTGFPLKTAGMTRKGLRK